MKEKEFLLSLQSKIAKRLKKIMESELNNPIDAFSVEEMDRFLSAMKSYNFRDYLIAKLIIKSGLRVNDVLGASIQNINFKCSNIHISTVKGHMIVDLDKDYLAELESYLDGRRYGLLFLTRNCMPVQRHRLNFSFANCSFKYDCVRISPEGLRVAAKNMSNRCQK